MDDFSQLVEDAGDEIYAAQQGVVQGMQDGYNAPEGADGPAPVPTDLGTLDGYQDQGYNVGWAAGATQHEEEQAASDAVWDGLDGIDIPASGGF